MIFVDLGAMNGDTVEQFINWGQVIGEISDAKVYAFEPNPNFKKEWEDIHTRHIKHVSEINFIQKAAWVEDGVMEFRQDLAPEPMGSTLMVDKAEANKETKIEVETMDFSQWLKQFGGEEIYIKMDIEGAEYPVLRKMIEDGTDKLVKLMMIEWHGNKMGTKWLNEQVWIIDNLSCKWIDWR